MSTRGEIEQVHLEAKAKFTHTDQKVACYLQAIALELKLTREEKEDRERIWKSHG